MEIERVASLENEVRALERRLALKDVEIEQMKLSNFFLETLFDGIQEEIMVVDAHYIIQDVNKVFLENYGLEKETALGKKCHEITYQSSQPCDFGSQFCPLKKARETGRRVGVTHARETPAGTREMVRIMYPLPALKAGAEYFIEISMDMTDQRRMEKTLHRSERLAAVGQAVARVAHEIKNPLMIIGGFSLQVRNSLSDEKAIQKLDMTLQEVRRLERLVAQLGDFTREHRLTPRPADINSVIRDVLDMMNGMHPGDKYRFEADLSPDLDMFECDPDKIKQVLMNMIVNAIEAMEEGGKVTVCTRRRSGGIEIAISDHGVGISHEDLDRIFEPFFSTRKRGSGLGLPISFRIIRAHQGEIRAESRPGQGTTFIITLPGPS